MTNLRGYKRNNEEYLNHLYNDLRTLVDGDMPPQDILVDGYEFEVEISRRTYIEILFSELEGIFDIEGYKKRLGG
jgi:hypothetical protein